MILLKNGLELFRTNVGSHMWKMNHKYSDIDVAVVYIQDSRDFLLGNRPKGKQVQTGDYDYTYYELSHVIHQLLKGNVNYLWAVMSPINISKYKSAFAELRQIVSENIAKNCYYSIRGLARSNIKKFVAKSDRNARKFKKKLNVIGRTVKFGINILVHHTFIFDKTDIKNESELYDLEFELDKAWQHSTLPEKPDPKPFEDYLIKWRLHKLRLDGLIVS